MNEFSQKDSVELLAPAGNMQALKAAVYAGADAVYLGLDEFNARRGADNFTRDNLKEAISFAHLYNVKIYLTLNIVIFQHEMNRALKLAVFANNCGVDAFIVQDVGLAFAVKKIMPSVNLHISTQMNIHNKNGISAAIALGAKRITLSRELSIEEILELANFAQAQNIELEVFAHGAICICYSGQCLMSSMIGSRSANRGTCAQACRLKYVLAPGGKNAKYNDFDQAHASCLLSPKDLCTIDILPDIVSSGVRSLKIEGRMKHPDYVFQVVSAYRSALDSIYNSSEYVVALQDKRKLAEAFSRGFTTAYMQGIRDNTMMSYKRPNNRGISIGRVKSISRNKIEISINLSVNMGDLLEIWTNRGKSLLKVDKNCKISSNKLIYQFNNVDKNLLCIKQNDRVFRIRNSADFFDEKLRRKKIFVDCNLELNVGLRAKITFTLSKNPICRAFYSGDVVETARTKPITSKEAFDHINRLGSSVFEIRNFEAKIDEDAGIGYGYLHKMRNTCLDILIDEIQDSFQHVVYDKKIVDKFCNDINISKLEKFCPDNDLELCVIATNPENARLAKKKAVKSIYVPLLNYKRNTALYAGCTKKDLSTCGYPRQTNYIFPVVSHECVGKSLESLKKFNIENLLTTIRPGNRFIADSIGDVLLAISYKLDYEIGYHIPVTNLCAVKYFQKLGAKLIWLSPELSLEQIKNIITGSVNMKFGMYIKGPVQLMVSEHCHLMSMGECNQNCTTCPRRQRPYNLVDKLNYKFPVFTDFLGRSHVYNSVELDLCHTFDMLKNIGISKVMIDSTFMDSQLIAQSIGRAKKSIDMLSDNRIIEKIKNTTTGHLFRDVK